jgi:hypothetical protein
MSTSYGVVWREGERPLARGKLELLPSAVRLDGMAGSERISREIPYDHLAEIRVGRTLGERIDGRACLVLAPLDGETLTIASVHQTGVVGELAERLSALQAGARGSRRLTLVLPLAPGALPKVRTLLADGPPFDPEALGLDRHHVYLTESEAIFVFESDRGAAALEPLLSSSTLWESAAAWQAHLAGPPRIAEDAFSWTRPRPGLDRSLLPPGLRNGDTRER